MRIATTHTTVKAEIPTTGAELLRTPTNMPGHYSYTFMAQSTHTTIAFEEIVATNSTILLCNFTLQEVGGGYVFGFGGMEKTNEVYGEGNEYTTEFRQYDPRLGRWLSIDPLFRNFPWQSPYAAFDNNPILIKDPRGLAGESSNGNPDKKMERQNKRFERLQNRLADKYGQGTDKYNSELARIGSKARYGSALEFHQSHRSPSTDNKNTGSTNSSFTTTFDNTKATHQEAPVFGEQNTTNTPQYPKPGDVAGETSFNVTVNDGQQVYMQASTMSGYQVQVFVNGQPLTQFAEAPQPAFDASNPQGATHIRVTEYKSAAISTGSTTPQQVTITFRTVFTSVGSQVHYTAYPIPSRTANVSIGTLR